MQPPETEPAICPSPRTATTEPTGRGAEPQVRVTVPITTCWPASRQATICRSTFRSTLSMPDVLCERALRVTMSGGEPYRGHAWRATTGEYLGGRRRCAVLPLPDSL